MQLWTKCAALGAILLFANGCVNAGPATTGPSFCEVYEPHGLPLVAQEAMTVDEIEAWEDNLIAYEVLCDSPT